ncbi:MAG: hydrogenobyrinic acid a,c-diamide synthase (glutamine-hydrolyzing) [Candidatus Thiodiazotropha sp. (ex Epidulcina cf. delphinae)]|nr:hydrogenobyrinic acid a,c-diamide synthase (glutamine-hydrolyzing) [Candidatus Thiodiazotropha sp. (ex Epidulcina cf. delphinae)]
MSAIYISAAHKSSGKTTLSIGLVRALVEKGILLQPFKKGPDYIDPLWLSAAAGRVCYNLDFYTQSREEILHSYTSNLSGKAMALIEGNKGLFDGLDIEGSNSNAAMAAFLKIPVVLVINCRGMTRGIAPLLLGYQAFDRQIEIAGVILNQVGGARHQSKLIQVVEHYTDIPVLGAVQADDRLRIAERHLGLIPSNEGSSSEAVIARLAENIRQHIDLQRVIEIAAKSPLPESRSSEAVHDSPPPYRLRIGIARDRAFGFYYPDDLDRFRSLGVELVGVDTLKDARLPEIDGLFLGGGFPETAMEALEANVAMRQAVADYIERGGPVYAECGGLMYLTRTLTWQGKKCSMVGVIPADTLMHDKPQGRGYVRLRDTGRGPWPDLREESSSEVIHAHEFHYSSLVGLEGDQQRFAYEVMRGTGIDGRYDGYVYKNLLASYTHMRSVGGNNWVGRFVAQVNACKQGA